MKLKIFGIIVLALVMASSLALVAPAGADWLAVPSPIAPSTGNPFWNNTSMDTGNKNIGYILTKQNDPIGGTYVDTDWINYGTNNSAGNAQYLGTSTGGVVNNVFFNAISPNGQGELLIVTVSAHSSVNSFGIYNMAATSFSPTVADANHVEIIPGARQWHYIYSPLYI